MRGNNIFGIDYQFEIASIKVVQTRWRACGRSNHVRCDAARAQKVPEAGTSVPNVTELVFELVNCDLADIILLAVPFQQQCHSRICTSDRDRS